MSCTRLVPRHLGIFYNWVTSTRIVSRHSSRPDRNNERVICTTWALTSQAKNKLAVAQTNMEISMLNIIYQDRKTNIWVREKTKVTDVIEQVRGRKWTWAGHVSRTRDNRWTSRITTWKLYEGKRSRGRPARRWKDELDDYWTATI